MKSTAIISIWARSIEKNGKTAGKVPDAESRVRRESGRLLKKVQMRGVEERDMRRTLLYASMTNDEDNNADGPF